MGKRILIVDDQEDFLVLLKFALAEAGYDAVAATNAIEAGIQLATHAPSLIIMDMKMPGINGLQACHSIRHNQATECVPIILMSAYFTDSDIDRAYRIGVVGCYPKSDDIEVLIKKVRKVLPV